MPSPFDDIFGSSGPQWTTDQITARIRGEAQKQGVDPDLALALATQESYLNPNAKGDNGKSIGLFQLQEAAAKDAGINPQWRDDPGINIYGGIRYFKMKLDQSKGNVDEALSRYNRGTPDYRGIGDPNYVQNVKRFLPGSGPQAQVQPQAQAQRPGMMARVASVFSPASAEASTPQQEATGTVWDDIFGGQQATPQPAAAPQPPTARSTPEQDAAYRQWAARQPAGGQQPSPPAAQTTPAPVAPPAASQGPQTPRLSMGDPREAATEPEARATIEALRASPAGARGLAPPPDLAPLAGGGGPTQQAPTVTDPAALLAGGRMAQPVIPATAPAPPAPATPASSTQIEPIQRGASDVVQAELQRPHEASIPLSAVPAMAVNTLGTVGGAALGAPFGPVGSAAGAALGGAAATRANTALGLAPQEKPLLETPWANVYPSDLLGAIPLGIAGATSAVKGTVRNLPGANVGRHELAAEKLEQLGPRVGPARPSSELFTEAAAQGGAVPMPTLWRAAGKVVREEKSMEKGFVSTEAMQAGTGLMNLMRKHGGNVPLEEVEKYRQRLGQKIGTTTDKAELARLQDLYGAIHHDLGLAATTGTTAGAGTLKAAIAAKRKEHAQETLTDIWSPGKGLQLQEGAHVQVYGKRIRNEVEKRLHQDKLFAGSFTPAEVNDIRTTLREVGKLTRVTNPDAQGTLGSTMKWLGRLGGAGYGATSGDLVTGGMMILATEGTSAVLARAMQSKLGRLALREAIREGNGTLTHGSLSAIAALLAREAAPEAPAPAPAPTP